MKNANAFAVNDGGMADVRELIERYRARIDELEKKLSENEGKYSRREEAISLKGEPYYSDIESVIDEVCEFADKYGISVKQAYGALYGEEKARKQENAKQKNSSGISALSQGGNRVQEAEDGILSPDEVWAAKKAGMSLADYLKFKKRGNE